MALNVLIVDDNRLMRSLVRRTLGMSDLPVAGVEEADGGAQALERLRNGWFDLMLLDLNMPGMDGEELLRTVRGEAALRALVVVVVSGESSPSRIARLRSLGAGFVQKPFKPESLSAEVARLAGKGAATAGGAAPGAAP